MASSQNWVKPLSESSAGEAHFIVRIRITKLAPDCSIRNMLAEGVRFRLGHAEDGRR